MNKKLLTSIAIGAMIFAGCSSKVPEVQTNASAHDMSVSQASENTINETDRLNALISNLQSSLKSIYFDFDKFNIRADQQGIIGQNAGLLSKSDASKLSIKVEGNCDEWGSDEYNYALGLKRAKAAKDALISNGVSEDRISVVSYGESNLVCSDKSKACDAQNRRADFKVFQ